VDFGVLALIVLAGLMGPLLGAGRAAFVPVVVGEILAGVLLGRTGLDAVDPGDPTVRFLSDVGFAMLMFTVCAHLPLRDPRLPAALRSGAVAAGVVLLLGPLAGAVSAWIAGVRSAQRACVDAPARSSSVLTRTSPTKAIMLPSGSRMTDGCTPWFTVSISWAGPRPGTCGPSRRDRRRE
jgi:hypothetical protein